MAVAELQEMDTTQEEPELLMRQYKETGSLELRNQLVMHYSYIAKTVAVKMSSIRTKVQFLSGGNQQKAIVSRWLLKDLDVLVFIEPTRGVDVGAKAEIYALISSLACAGLAIVITSSEIGEILGMSDRILVLNNGRVSREFARGEADQRALLSAALVDGDAPQGGGADET